MTIDELTPSFDASGYPTDEFLQQIATCDVASEADCRALLQCVADAWHYDLSPGADPHEFRFATGGWSGNEELIGALERNLVLQALCWQSSHRGGLHVYRVPEFAQETPP